MADNYVNVAVDAERIKKLEGAGLAGQVKDIGGKKVIQVPVSDKEQKKLLKGFPDLVFSASGATLPAEAETKLFDIVVASKTVDVMKAAIMKLYNPLAGKAPRSAIKH